MEFGIGLGFGNVPGKKMTDAEMMRAEVNLGVISEELGFDSVWSVEHHFDSYSMMPNNMHVLSHIAAKTERIKLGTGAVILPWHNPIRVAEEMIMLDILSKGRARFGMGRGLSPLEYGKFQVDMGESRERFDEAAAMIIDALETGVLKGDGKYYATPEVPIRPQPEYSFKDRIYCVASSKDSIVSATKLKAKLLSFLTRPVEEFMPTVVEYQDLYRETNGEEPTPIMLNINVFCHEDREYARQKSDLHTAEFYEANVNHYNFGGSHLDNVKGYERHAKQNAELRKTGLDKARRRYQDSALAGTPDELIERLLEIHRGTGDFEMVLAPTFGGMPYDEAEKSLKLFAQEVLPTVRAEVAKRSQTGPQVDRESVGSMQAGW